MKQGNAINVAIILLYVGFCPNLAVLLFLGLKQSLLIGSSVYLTANSEESDSEFQPYDDNSLASAEEIAEYETATGLKVILERA